MDTTGKTRAEIDALRALAAKAHAEGAYAQAGLGSFSGCRLAAEKWAAEELPYPTVTLMRVVRSAGTDYQRPDGPYLQYCGDMLEPWCPSLKVDDLKSLASLLTRDELLAIANGVCGPTEDVTP